MAKRNESTNITLRNEYKKELVLRMFYLNEDGESLIYGQAGGILKYIDSTFFPKLEYWKKNNCRKLI